MSANYASLLRKVTEDNGTLSLSTVFHQKKGNNVILMRIPGTRYKVQGTAKYRFFLIAVAHGNTLMFQVILHFATLSHIANKRTITHWAGRGCLLNRAMPFVSGGIYTGWQ